MAFRMLFKIGLKLLTSIAVLDGVPEGHVESLRGDFLGRRRRWAWGESAVASSRVPASEAKVPSGYRSR
jgi:hypothetical protein